MKTITVPLNKKAVKLLDCNKCPSNLLEEMYLSQQEFDSLWEAGVFQELNKIMNIIIDEYEDDSIVGETNLLHSIRFIESTKYLEPVQSLVTKIKSLMVLAIEKNTGIYFYF